MTFHENSEEFKEAIQAAAEYFNIRSVLIEKDYWVSLVLKKLSESEYKDQVVFKGGTSLSKTYTYIARFSEDIDLALLEGKAFGDAKRKTLFKNIENTITAGLTQIKNHPETHKKGKNRRTFFDYPKTFSDPNIAAIKDVIQVELNSFTNPIPNSELAIQSLLYKFLTQQGYNKEVKEYALEPVSLNVLSLERTFSEKLLSLIRLSYKGIDSLKSKIRHFYDLHKIVENNNILVPETIEIIALAKQDDKSNPLFNGEWLNNTLSEAPLFKNLEKYWDKLESRYKEELPQLCWLDEIPSSEQVLSSMKKIKTFVEEYEKV